MTTEPTAVPPTPSARLRADDDAGVSLAEVIVAMFIISGIVAALAGLLIQSLSSLKSDQSYQVATQLVNVRVEETRALSTAALNAGIPPGQISSAKTNGEETQIIDTGTDTDADPNRTNQYRFGGETVISTTSTLTSGTPLNPYRTTETVDNVTFNLATYITRCWQPKAEPGKPSKCNPAPTATTDAPRAPANGGWPK